MTPYFASWEEHTLDLAIDRFTVGLEPRDVSRLEDQTTEQDLRDFEYAVAAIHLSALGELESPPAALLDRLVREGQSHVNGTANAPKLAAEPQHTPASTPRGPSKWVALGGWLVAAGLLATLFLLQSSGSDVHELRETLIASAGDVLRIDWTATPDAAAVGTTGDVVWSSSAQQGYMRFRDLEPNDREKAQYQLWIFDPTRADWEDKPVDGGVFDVPTRGEVIVPIDAKLAVQETALFAVTLEVPGGVVVSERERLVLTAAP